MLAQLAFNGLIAGATYSLVAVGLAAVYGAGRFFNFAHGAVFAVGAYTVYASAVVLHFPLSVSLLVAIAITGALGLVLEVLVFRRLRRRHATPLVSLVASMGLYVVLQNVLSVTFGDRTLTIKSAAVIPATHLAGILLTGPQITILAASFAVAMSIWALMAFTEIGKAYRALVSDPDLAAASGIDCEKAIVVASVGASALVGAAAALMVLDVDIYPTVGLNVLMMAIVAVIIGGGTSPQGALLGGVAVGIIQNVAGYRLQTEWQDAAVLAVLLLVVLLKPRRVNRGKASGAGL
jgi:branched-subunit amino acid ABC-type transport system permease component